MQQTENLPFTLKDRECGECTKCCEGRLEAVIYGQRMHPGNPCRFLCKSNGCTIYNDRPENPCRIYKCAWIADDTFPLWMQPHLTNIIINKKTALNDAITYYDVIEAGGKMSAETLNWLLTWALKNRKNISYEILGRVHHLGDGPFVQYMNERDRKDAQKVKG